MKALFIILFLLLSSFAKSQTNGEVVADTTVYKVVEQMAEYPEGNAAMMKFIFSNLKIPVISVEEGIQGKIIIRFIVEKDGSLSNIEVIQPDIPEWKTELVEVMKSMPEWIPGKQNGRPVRVEYTLPMNVHWQK